MSVAYHGKPKQNTNQGIKKVIYKIDKWPRNSFLISNGISELKKMDSI